MLIPRRKLLLGAAAGICAPAIVRAQTLNMLGAGSANIISNVSTVTWNPAAAEHSTNCILSSGNLNAASNDSGWAGVRATQGYSSGAYYFEIKIVTTPSNAIVMNGIGDQTNTGTNILYPGGTANSIGTRGNDQFINGFIEDDATHFGVTETTGDIFMFAVDVNNKKVWRGYNGNWLSGNTPTVGGATQWAHWTPAYTVFPWGGINSVDPIIRLQPNSSSFTYSPPSGFSAWG